MVRRRPAAGRKVGGGGRHDPALQAVGWLDDRDDLGEGRDHGAELRDLGMAVRVRGQVRPDRRRLIGFEGVEDVGGRKLADLVTGQVAHGVEVAHVDPTSSDRRIASRPRRIRLLTVPSGVPVRSAISCWVRPPK